MRRSIRLSAVLAMALVATPVLAAPDGDDVRARARAVGVEALTLFDSGRYAEALEHFERADAIFRAPTHGLMAARCLEKLGRLVEASSKYLAVTGMELDAKASPVFREAKVDAARELQALLPRIPTVSIELAGAPGAGVAVTLDGKPVENTGTPSSVDPGPHRIEARRGAAVVAAQDFALIEGESRRVTLTLPPAPRIEPPAGPVAPARTGADARWGAQPILGWAGVGLGGAGLLLGSIAGGMAVAAQGELDERGCKDGVCPRATSDDVDRYNTLRSLSTAGFIAGSVLAAGGVVLLLTAPKGAEHAAALRVAPGVGEGSVAIRGTF